MRENNTFGIPRIVGQASGLFAGAAVGLQAGKIIGSSVVDHLPGFLQGHSGLVQNSFGCVGAFGCAYAGHLLASEKPEKALLVAAGTLVSQYGLAQLAGNHPHAEHEDVDHQHHDLDVDLVGVPHDASVIGDDVLDPSLGLFGIA